MNTFIQKNYFIGICAFVLTLCTYLVFGTIDSTNLWYSFALLFGTQIIYSSLRLDKIIRELSVQKHFLKQEIIPFIGTVLCLFLAKPTIFQIALLVVSLFFSFVYGAHIWQPMKKISLRNNAWFKLLAIGIVWAITTVVIPLLDYSEVFTIKQWLYISSIFLLIVYLTLPFEMNDASAQRQTGYETVATLVGQDMTAKTGRMMAILAWLLTGFVSVPVFIAMSVSVVVYLKFLNQNIEQLDTKQLTIRFDGVIILFAVLCVLFLQIGL